MKNYIICLMILLPIHFQSNAFSPKHKNGEEFYSLAYDAMASDPAKAIQYLAAHIALSKENNNKKALCSGYFLQAYILINYLNTPEEAYSSYLKAMDNVPEKETAMKFQILESLGKISYHYGFFQAAKEVYAEAIALARKENEMDKEVFFTKWVGFCYYKMGKAAEALDMFERGKRLSEMLSDVNKTLEFVNSKARVQISSRDYDASIITLKGILAVNQEIDPKLRIRVLNNLGYAFLKSDQIEKADSALSECYTLAQSQNLVSPVTYNNLGWVSLTKKDFSLAKTYFQKSEKASKGTPGDEDLIDAYSGLARVYTAEGNLAQAAAYQQKTIDNLKPLMEGADKLRTLASQFTSWKSESKIAGEKSILSESQKKVELSFIIAMIFVVVSVLTTVIVNTYQIARFRSMMKTESDNTFGRIERTLVSSTLTNRVR